VTAIGSCTLALMNGIYGVEVTNNDRIAGSAKEIKGSVDKVEGKVQNAIGGLKDTLKE
jgi:hypothetical protein